MLKKALDIELIVHENQIDESEIRLNFELMNGDLFFEVDPYYLTLEEYQVLLDFFESVNSIF